MRKLLLLSLFLGSTILLFAQINCSLNYYLPTGSTTIMSYNPATNTTASTGITLPSGGAGLAVANNLNGGTPSPTFYTVVGGQYRWWNGTTWVATNHSSGGTAAVNPGGSGPYIYNLIGSNGQVWRYDGSGNAVLVVTVTGFGGPYDVIGDSQGNVYVLNTSSGNQQMRVYNPQGQLICTYTLVGLPTSTAGGGYAVVNGMLYVNLNSAGTWRGTFNGTTINFTQNPMHIEASDFGSCEFPPFNTSITSTNNSQIDMCAGGTVNLTSTTSITGPIYNWSGPGIVSGQGTTTITVNQPGTYSLTVTSGTGMCSATSTTTHVITASSTGPTLTPQAPLCIDGTPVQIQASMPGGTWGSSCSTCLSSTGVFNPQVAGVGTHTINYTVAGTCSTPASMQIVVNALPTIDAGADRTICTGTSTTLTATGGSTYVWNNGITNGGQVTPTGSTTYTVIGTDANGCRNSDDVTVNVSTMTNPTFNQVDGICSGEALSPLPLISLNGVTGTWSPALNNTTTTTYTFTPSEGQCASTATLTIPVQQSVVTSFEQLTPICSGEQVAPLSNVSLNGVTGSWNAAINNQITTTYVFTPDAGQCASSFTTTLNVTPSVVSSFEPFVPVCFGEQIAAFSNTSLNGIVGQWSPAPNNLQTTSYTFTPNAGQCAAPFTGTLPIRPLPNVNAGPDIRLCENNAITLIASGAVDYTWSNDVVNNEAFIREPGQYTFVVEGVDAFGCRNSDEVTVIVDANPIVEITWVQDNVCSPSSLHFIRLSDQELMNCRYDFGGGIVSLNCDDAWSQVFITPNVYPLNFTAQSIYGCPVSYSVQEAFTVGALPTAAFTVENPAMTTDDRVVRVNNQSQGATNYDWRFGMGLTHRYEFEPEFEYPSAEALYEIRLIAISELGCVDTAYAQARVEDGLIYYVPNAFTPDGDEFNQVFKPIFKSGIDTYSYTLMIYNRWGEAIFESHNLEVGWDGTYVGEICPSGVYTWTISAKRYNNDERFTVVGHLTLLR